MCASRPEQRVPIGFRDLGAAAVLYTFITAVATWPLLLHFRDRVPGAEWWHSQKFLPESLINLWNLWWFRYALLELGQDPFDGTYILHPFGANLWFHTLAPLHGLIGIVLQTFVSLTVTQNLMLLFDLVMAGVCTFALALHLGLGRAPALVAGGIYAFSPTVFAHLFAGHYELIATYWLPAMLLSFLRLIDLPVPRPWDAAVLGLLFVGAAYSSQYYCVYGVELLIVAAIVRGRRTLRPATLRAFAVTAVIVLIGWGPLLWAFMGASAPRLDAGGEAFADFDHHSGDGIGFFVPPFTHPLLAEPLGATHERLNPPGCYPQETTTYVGWVVLGLALLGAVARWRAREPLRLLLAVALVFSVLSLGSHLRIYGSMTGIPLPGLLLEQLPLLRLARAPGRHIVVAMLGFAMLAAAGWQQLRPAWLGWPVLALLAFDFAALPVPSVSTQVAPVYHRLAEVPGDFAILEVPLSVRDGHGGGGVADNRQIFAQTVHHHRIVSGMVSRIPEEKWQVLVDAPIVGTLLRPDLANAQTLRRDRAEGPAFVSRWAIDAVVVQASASGTPWERYLESVLPIRSRERFADGTQLLWLRDP